MKKINVAIVGATGLVGNTLFDILVEREFPVDNMYLLSSTGNKDKTFRFKGKTLYAEALEDFDFSNVHLAFFCAGGEVSSEYVPKAVESGCKVIDNSSIFRQDAKVPLVIPSVNKNIVKDAHKIIANPNCSTIQMLTALAPLHAINKIKSIHVSTYQAVSGAGSKAISELVKQVSELLNGRPVTPEIFEEQIAFNVIPNIGELDDNGYSEEELKMHFETRKILQSDDIEVNATAVRVPVLYGHSESLSIEFSASISVGEVISALKNIPEIEVYEDGKRATPFAVGAGGNKVHVSRIRQSLSNDKVINLWVVADNVRKGGALNSVQIAEELSWD